MGKRARYGERVKRRRKKKAYHRHHLKCRGSEACEVYKKRERERDCVKRRGRDLRGTACEVY